MCVAACGGKVAIDHVAPLDAPDAAPEVDAAADVDAGASSVIAYPTLQPFKMAQDTTSLYWTQGWAGGEVAKVGKDGGTPVVLATKQGGPFGIAVDSTSVYFVDEGLTTSSGSIMKMDLDGGSLTALATAQGEPVTLAIDSSHVYWTNFGWMGASTIVRADLDGSNATTIGTGTSVSWIAVGAGYVWWAGNGANGPATVTRAELDGSNPTIMLTTTGGFDGIGVDSTSLYATDWEKLVSVPVDGGTPTTLATYSPEETSASIVSDGPNLYWSVAFDLEVTGLDGGVTTAFATGPPPMSIVVDASYVYWLSDNPQTLSRLPKP